MITWSGIVLRPQIFISGRNNEISEVLVKVGEKGMTWKRQNLRHWSISACPPGMMVRKDSKGVRKQHSREMQMLCFTQVIKEKVPGKYPITFNGQKIKQIGWILLLLRFVQGSRLLFTGLFCQSLGDIHFLRQLSVLQLQNFCFPGLLRILPVRVILYYPLYPAIYPGFFSGAPIKTSGREEDRMRKKQS